MQLRLCSRGFYHKKLVREYNETGVKVYLVLAGELSELRGSSTHKIVGNYTFSFIYISGIVPQTMGLFMRSPSFLRPNHFPGAVMELSRSKEEY